MDQRSNPTSSDAKDSVRINKYISSSGFCSRRKADEYVQAGCVTIDGETAESGSQVFPGQVVLVNGKPVIPTDDHVYLAFHKPLGITCTTDRRDKSNIIDYIHYPMRIFPIGRLDKNSTGLILLTNDGDIVNRLLRAEGRHDKEYVVTVDKPVDEDFKRKMEGGLPILNTITLPCKVKLSGKNTFHIILNQGLNRQIRRMCEYLGYKVVRLKRIRILNLSLGTLPVGQYRELTAKERKDLFSILEKNRK
ncbi:MAG TPA: 23S rRNA pseudouridine synthase F [Clostridiales bacterium]|nr:23S rRNA pseudouridine synthase F [Clostridiales bacterium]